MRAKFADKLRKLHQASQRQPKKFGCLFYARASQWRRPEWKLAIAKVKPATAACHGVVQRSRKSCAAPRSRAIGHRNYEDGYFGCLFYARASHWRRPEWKLAIAKGKPATAACHGVVQRSRKSCAAPRSRANWQVTSNGEYSA